MMWLFIDLCPYRRVGLSDGTGVGDSVGDSVGELVGPNIELQPNHVVPSRTPVSRCFRADSEGIRSVLLELHTTQENAGARYVIGDLLFRNKIFSIAIINA